VLALFTNTAAIADTAVTPAIIAPILDASNAIYILYILFTL
jgi:hypothetical protein